MTISEKVSESLRGKYGEEARRWKGNRAGYVAIHLWIKKHWGTPDHCDMCHKTGASRYEWSNKDKLYRRLREDWLQLCPSCHRKYDHSLTRERLCGNKCKNGHLIAGNLAHNIRGHRYCKACNREAQRRYVNAKNK